MLNQIKILLGDAANNYSEELINLAYEMAVAEVEAYCNRNIDTALELVACQIAVIKLNRTNTEGLTAQSFSGISESYIDGYPANIVAILNRKRLIKVV